MITSYLQLLVSQLNDGGVYDTYTNFRDLIYASHSNIGPLTETTHTHNAFLLAFCDRPTLIKHAPMIIRDMATQLPASAIHVAEKRPLKQAVPCVITWSIFSHGFVKAGQMAAAEKVIELMRKRNLEPSEITWGSLLSGYSAAQNVEKVAEVYGKMKRMPMEFRVKDPEIEAGYTMAALGRVKNRVELVRALRGEEKEDERDEWVSTSPMRGAPIDDVHRPDYDGQYGELSEAVSGWVETG